LNSNNQPGRGNPPFNLKRGIKMNDNYLTLDQIYKKYKIAKLSIIDFEKKYNIKNSGYIFNKNGKKINVYSIVELENKVSSLLNDKSEELQKWLNDDKHVQISELAKLWKISKTGVISFMKRKKIKPVKTFELGNKIGRRYFYNKQECLSARERINIKRGEKVNLKQLEVIKNEKPMQTPDFIPADTLDIYTLDQLKVKIPGIENHYEMFNKSEVPEYQEIARMLRGNQKSVNLWGKMIEGIKKEIGAVVEKITIPGTGSNLALEFKNNADMIATGNAEQIKMFIADVCIVDRCYKIKLADLYDCYLNWVKKMNIYPLTKHLMTKTIQKIGGKTTRLRDGVWVLGLQIKSYILSSDIMQNDSDKSIELLEGTAIDLLKKKVDECLTLQSRVAELENFIDQLKINLQSLLK